MKINIAEAISNHIRGRFWLYIISSLSIGIGFVIGVYTVKYMNSYEKNDLMNYILSFTKTSGTSIINYNSVLLETFKNNIPLILIIWFLGLTMLGIPVILIIDFLKGFTLGFTITFFVNSLGVKGITMAFLGILPQNLIYIPCILFISVIAMEFSMGIVKYGFNDGLRNRIFSKISSYSLIFLFAGIFMGMGVIFETYCTPNIVKLTAMQFSGSIFL
ncbi:stage II sporulation protein M [Clostridium felsineum]|uniref:Stage II sporulation protein M n=1 Tax=Clostridium felsineum TaxID=36839 RepID=A0A1S8L4N0_9CLOT|nr:stage II sporulation protein M [Clostridium felsineum]MCR3760208.1 stage II sporulation protein M [Clostridium felsineum]URZ00602.1 Stage II sporulation protein M [Clostridium felsineum]URZ06758.1 Stage II sporulation protein M [Clostridium felsineum]URZ11790.1 Stage II sporulation protein M [Clostridium felsineum]URZ16352.1 Stage II sporulation protein M [Clostridium felsineum DSM 794]